MPRPAHSVGRSIIALPLALTLAWTLPIPAFAAPPDPTAAPEAAPIDGAQPQPVADPAAPPQPVPAPVYQPQLMPQPQPMPPAPNRNRGLGLILAGTSVFTISYIISAVAGAAMIDSGDEEVGRPLLIPIVGPFIAIGHTDSALFGLGLGFAGIAQLAGLGMGIGGGVMLARSRRQPRLTAAPGGLQLRF